MTGFHDLSRMDRRAFLAGLMALPAAAAVPGLSADKVYGVSPVTQALDEAFLEAYTRELWKAMQGARIYGTGSIHVTADTITHVPAERLPA